MLHIFQIGNVRLFNKFGQERGDTGVQTPLENVTGVQKLPWTSKKLPGFGGYSVTRGDITIKDMFINSEHFYQYQRENQYAALLTQPYVDVIAYRYAAQLDSSLGARIDLARTPPLIWYHTTAVLKKIDPHASDYYIELTLTLLDEWEALNRYAWDIYQTPRYPEVESPAIDPFDNMSSLPNQQVLIHELNRYWSKKIYDDPLYYYSPDVWASWHLRLPIGYPDTGYGTDWSTQTQYSFYLDTSLWSGRTRSLFQWKGLSPTGSIDMVIDNRDTFYGVTTYTNTINLEYLDTLLSDAGYTGLLTTDILMVDEYQGKRSFIIRNDEILNEVYPIWTFSGTVIGQTGGGTNTIRLYYTKPVEYTFYFAQLHHFKVI